MMLSCLDLSEDVSLATTVILDAVTDSSTDSVTADITAADNVTETMSSSVHFRPKRHSMALAVDTDIPPPDSDDVRTSSL